MQTPSSDPAHERVLVIGADAAGMSAAHQALRTAAARGRELDVVVLDAGQHTSYSACGIPYVVSGEVGSTDQLVARTAEQHREAGIDLRLGVRVVRLDLESRLAEVEVDGSPAAPVAFDQVVVASGARPVTPAWARAEDGTLLDGVRHAKTLDDANAWGNALRAGDRVVVAGGGYIGVEMVEAALRRGAKVTLVTRSRVLSSFAPETSERVEAALRRAGAEVVLHADLQGVEAADGRVQAVVLGDRVVPADHLVLALGVVPATDFLAHTDLLHGRRAALRPDPTGRVADGIWAAGDCCEVMTRQGFWTYAPLGTHATKMGRVLGAHLGGGDPHGRPAEFPGALGTSITRFAHGDVHVEVARTGVLDSQVTDPAVDLVALTTEGTTASGYMPEARPIAIRVAADRVTRRLLSVELVGGEGAGKRIDTAAAVLHFGGTVDDLAWMDLSYAPPVATAWEVLQIAARRLAERL